VGASSCIGRHLRIRTQEVSGGPLQHVRAAGIASDLRVVSMRQQSQTSVYRLNNSVNFPDSADDYRDPRIMQARREEYVVRCGPRWVDARRKKRVEQIEQN
jgi:hypothetical protein